VGKVFIAGTGVETTQESILLTKEAADIGAKAAMVLPPYFYKAQMNHEVLIRHYLDLADSSPIDIILYNVPEFTGLEFQLETLLELADHPKIVGMKDSSGNILRMSRLAANRPKFKIFCGVGVFLPYLSIGSRGGIMALSNIAPEPLYQILDDFLSGQIEKAREIQWNLVDINAAITTTYGVPGLKYAMEKLGLYGGVPRRPLLPLGEEGRKRIDALISVSGLKALKMA
jgi:4-hydroxy-2-oxoglutarate aldolase